MREIRIYQPGVERLDQVLELSPQAAQHVAVVLRMQVGQHLILFHGTNFEYHVVIEKVHKKQVIVRVRSVQETSRESPLLIHLAQAISKGERMELVMQKSVELGVASIRPLITEHCAVKLDKERMAKRLHQWQSIVIAACEQSGRTLVPMVHPPLSLNDYLTKVDAQLKLILHPKSQVTWRDYIFNNVDIALLIGPEGGFSEDEIKEAYQHGFLPLSLGPRILRTETAAITALSILQAVGGDL